MNAWNNNLALYDELVARNPNFERKGKTMPYTSANGYMFSLLNKDGEFRIRLPKEKAKEFKEKFTSGVFKSHGAKMNEFVLVPRVLFSDPEQLDEFLQESYAFVMSKPPK